MNSKTFLAFSAATLALTGTAAIAQQQDRGGDLTLADMKARGDKMFARMDANSDGVINAEDREVRRQQMFAKMDTNGDGEISQAEMQAAQEARQQRRERDVKPAANAAATAWRNALPSSIPMVRAASPPRKWPQSAKRAANVQVRANAECAVATACAAAA